MVSGYIPASWAALRRWQEALTLKGSRVTKREHETLDQALSSITQQLMLEKRALLARPDQYVRLQQPVIDALGRELENIAQTRDRLLPLRFEPISEADVYGQFAQQADVLADNLPRWLNHPENQVVEQLASAPAEVMSHDELIASLFGQPIGAPSTVDILSYY